MSSYGFHSGSLRELSIVSPSNITANQTDYAPTGHMTAATLRIKTGDGGALSIFSLAGGAQGRIVRIVNIGTADSITLVHDDGANGTAANRFLCAANTSVAIRINGSKRVEYDATTNRWRVDGA